MIPHSEQKNRISDDSALTVHCCRFTHCPPDGADVERTISSMELKTSVVENDVGVSFGYIYMHKVLVEKLTNKKDINAASMTWWRNYSFS